MASSFGTTLRTTIFGQSHSTAIGCVVEGLPVGFTPDLASLQAFMSRRAPGQASWTTPRKEADTPRILSGLNSQGETCGAPLAIVIENTNVRSSDYNNILTTPRPGHADFTAQVKWQGHQDVSGGGHFSGRLTAPLCAAGGIALQLLASRGVRIAAHLLQVGNVTDEPFCARFTDPQATAKLIEQMDALADSRSFPTIQRAAADAMIARIDEARQAHDSVGGAIECVAYGLPAGIGGPMFDGIESSIARIIFGVPAVKSLAFGAGTDVAHMSGSENNDPFGMVDGSVCPLKNDAGGNLGGISTGAPVLFRMAIKPTPSIAQEQASVNLQAHTEETLVIKGRHDPCIAPRAVPVAEAVMALALLDCWLTNPARTDW